MSDKLYPYAIERWETVDWLRRAPAGERVEGIVVQTVVGSEFMLTGHAPATAAVWKPIEVL